MTEVIYPFEQLDVTLKGVRWSVTGTAILKAELGVAFTEPGWIAITQVDRLRDTGELDYEDVDWNLWYPEERLDLVGLISTTLNTKPDRLSTWYYERIEQ